MPLSLLDIVTAPSVAGNGAERAVDGRHVVVAAAQTEIPTFGSGMRRGAQSHRRDAGQGQHANFHCSTLA